MGGWVGYLVHRKTDMTFSSSILLLHSFIQKGGVGGWVV